MSNCLRLEFRGTSTIYFVFVNKNLAILIIKTFHKHKSKIR